MYWQYGREYSLTHEPQGPEHPMRITIQNPDTGILPPRLSGGVHFSTC